MDLKGITGKYEERGSWKDSDGESGNLEGNIQEIRFEENKLYFCYSDGEECLVSEIIHSGDLPIRTSGNHGEGTLLIGADIVILEYEADIDGRVERNTDIWTFSGDGVQRAGVIRQDKRVIWFEAQMIKIGS